MKIYLYLLTFLISFNVHGQENNLLDSCYVGGAKKFHQLFGKNIKYSDKNEMGLCILYWEIHQGRIQNTSILNSLGKSTTNELNRILQLTTNNWKISESRMKFYLPIKYSLDQLDYNVDPFPKNYLDQITVVGYLSDIPAFRSEEYLVSKLNRFLEKKKYKSAISILDKMLRRNPVSIELRETRIDCYQKSELDEEACNDILILKNYLQITSKYLCEKDL
ncbi:hypothetical protein [Flammeovirga sp. SubArs3]|uniref:hypothetical protein n=1 Tax=Flammeovirga sp. SubArs3 TaxID=2995316 RepID=UPI00248B0BB0|nr:hypothetical protein [Flammeovirga sp. SubArs3]